MCVYSTSVLMDACNSTVSGIDHLKNYIYIERERFIDNLQGRGLASLPRIHVLCLLSYESGLLRFVHTGVLMSCRRVPF
jgi:hypothetical protein